MYFTGCPPTGLGHPCIPLLMLYHFYTLSKVVMVIKENLLQDTHNIKLMGS